MAIRHDPVRRAAREVLDAYDRYIDTDNLDPLAQATGRLREALLDDVVVVPSTPEIKALADEAERGYNVRQIRPKQGPRR